MEGEACGGPGIVGEPKQTGRNQAPSGRDDARSQREDGRINDCVSPLPIHKVQGEEEIERGTDKAEAAQEPAPCGGGKPGQERPLRSPRTSS